MDEDDDLTWIPKAQIDLMLLRTNIELVQKVQRLIELLEQNNERHYF